MAEENKVVFRCENLKGGKLCGKPFIVRQGSRRKFCDDCLVERISHKGEKEGRDARKRRKGNKNLGGDD